MSKNTSHSESANHASPLITVEVSSLTSTITLHVHWLEIESPSGFFVVGSGHTNTISQLKPGGTLTYENKDGTHGSLPVPGGVAVIQNNVIKIVLFPPSGMKSHTLE